MMFVSILILIFLIALNAYLLDYFDKKKKETRVKGAEKLAIKQKLSTEIIYEEIRNRVLINYPLIDFNNIEIESNFSTEKNSQVMSIKGLSFDTPRICMLLIKKIEDAYRNSEVNLSNHREINKNLFPDNFWQNEEKNRNTKLGRDPADWAARRSVIHDRDEGWCRRCGVKVAKDKCHIHHIKMRSEGGNHSLDNLITLCKDCHTLMNKHENMKSKQLYYISKNRLVHLPSCHYSRSGYKKWDSLSRLYSIGYKTCKKCNPWRTHKELVQEWEPRITLEMINIVNKLLRNIK